MKIEAVLETDVLVIGAGAAGLQAAGTALRQGVRVLLCTKKAVGSGGSTFLYPGGSIGMNAITHPETGDTEETFYGEMLAAGDGALIPELTRILAESCTSEFREMEQKGVSFRRNTDGSYCSVVPCFGRLPRGGNAPVAGYRQALLRYASGATWLPNTTILSLVTQSGICCGAVAADACGQLLLIRAGAVVLATGGAADLFRYAESSCDLAGDGCAMAYLAGVPLINLEFVQFAPAIVWPVPCASFWTKALLSPFTLTNQLGERFLPRYLPQQESLDACIQGRVHDDPFSVSNSGRYFDIALFEEWRAGRACAHGGLHIQFEANGLAENPYPFTASWKSGLLDVGVDVCRDGCEILPHAFACNGGVVINQHGGTALPGLYAAGETAGGPHGADRIGGSAMAAALVFGRLAGKAAAAFSFAHPSAAEKTSALHQLMSQCDTGYGAGDSTKITDEIRNVMWKCSSLARTESRCNEGLSLLMALEHSINPTASLSNGVMPQKIIPTWHRLLMAKNILKAVQFRKESRGAHYRADFPRRSSAYSGYTLVQHQNGVPMLQFVPNEG